ncbi:hypothetical protein HDV05_004740 [Chytridiales sp. JEL 0842]|nr:hypothetical protein HDV05_004740 [Chytridiales sp. JEL 0842]
MTSLVRQGCKHHHHHHHHHHPNSTLLQPTSKPTTHTRSLTPVTHQTANNCKRRSVTSSSLFIPVTDIHHKRIPIDLRRFPLWRYKPVERTVFASETVRDGLKSSLSREQVAPTELEASTAGVRRVPGWEALYAVLEVPVRTKVDDLKGSDTLESKLEVDKELQWLVDALNALSSSASEDKVEMIHALYLELAANYNSTTMLVNYARGLDMLVETSIAVDGGWLGSIRELVIDFASGTSKLQTSVPKDVYLRPFITYIRAMCKHHTPQVAVEFTETMRECGVIPDSLTYEPIVSACTPSDMSLCFFALETLLKSQEADPQNTQPVSMPLLNRSLQLCFEDIEGKYPNASKEVFELIHEIHGKPNPETAVILLAQVTMEQDLRVVWNDIHQWDLESSDMVQQAVLETAYRISDPDRQQPLLACQEWIVNWRRSGVKVSQKAIRYMTNLHLEAGTASTALSHILSNQVYSKDILATCIKVLKSVGVATEKGGVDAREERLVWSLIQKLVQSVQSEGKVVEPPSTSDFGEIVKAMGRVGDSRGVHYLYSLLHNHASTLASSTKNLEKLPKPQPLEQLSLGVPIKLTSTESQSLLQRVSITDPKLLQAFSTAFTSRLISDLPTASAFVKASRSQSALLTLLQAPEDPVSSVAGAAIRLGIGLEVDKAAEGIVGALKARREVRAQGGRGGREESLRWMGPRLTDLGALGRRAKGRSEEGKGEEEKRVVAEAAARVLVREVKKVQEGKDAEDALKELERLLAR